MAKPKFIFWLHRRTALLLFLASLSAILLTAVAINAQKKTRPRPGPATGKTAQAGPRSQPARKSNATCDDLAAHPEDKGRSGTGVADEKIAPVTAIEQCALAVQQSPNAARFHFQLGRAYWAAKQYDEALDAFLKAEEMGYAPAYFYLGQAYEQGLIAGEQADPAVARNLYMIAAAEGFGPAIRAYQGTMGSMAAGEIDFSEFKQPALLRAFYEENYDALNKERNKALFYAKGIIDFLNTDPQQFEEPDLACIQIASVAVSKELARLTRNAARDGTEDTIQGQGMNDIYLFAYDYGTCEGAAVGQVYDTIERFVNPEALANSQLPLVGSRVGIMEVFGSAELWGSGGIRFITNFNYLPEPHRGMVRQQIDDLRNKNQQIIECLYGTTPTHPNITSQFWYKSPPANVRELIDSVPRGEHPLRYLGLNAVEVCPASPALAQKARRAGRIR